MKINKSVKEIQLQRLEKYYGEYNTALEYTSQFTLLVAVILSAQCTDKRVNIITKRIFPKLDTPEKMVKLSQSELEKEIRDCGLYKSKAKHLLGMCNVLLKEYNGEVPHSFEDLIKLPGVGRKTANVVRSVAWGYPAIAVDTHVFRVSNRLNLAKGKKPLDVELELQKTVPKEKWSACHHWLIWHGRKFCHARNPDCKNCFLSDVCPSNTLKKI